MLVKYATVQAAIVDRILDPNKIAALNIFPNFNKRTAAIEPIKLYPDQFLYLRNRSISALETHGANQNGDAFPRAELKKAHRTFIGDPVTLDHTEGRVVGMVLDSVWVPKQIFKKASGQLIPYNTTDLEPGDQIVGDWVENILAVNKRQADIEHPNLTEQILDGEVTDTSMGTMVDYSVCSVPGCRKQATIPNEYCNHVAGFKGRIYSGADTHDVEHQVYEENYGLTFFEDSVIIPDKLGGTAGGEGADPGAKMLEQLANKKINLDLSPYIVNRKANIKTAAPTNGPVNYGEETVDIGGEPESVEKSKEKHQDIQERNNDNLKSEQLKLQIQQIVDDLEDSLEHLKIFTDDSAKPYPEDALIQGNKYTITGTLDDIIKAAQLLDKHEIIYNTLKRTVKSVKNEQKIAVSVEFIDTDLYKLNSLMREFKNADIHIEGGINMKKGQKIVIKSTVKAFKDGKLTLAVDKAEIPITEGLIASLKSLDADTKISLASNKKAAISHIYVKADESMGEIDEGDSIEIPGVVSEEADDDGNIVVELDVDHAETDFKDETVPVNEISIPEDSVEVEEESEESETGDFEESVMEASKKSSNTKKAMTPGKEPSPKDKLPDAGKNSGDNNKAHNEELSTLQKRHTPAPKDKVPDAGKHASNKKKADVADPNISNENDPIVDIDDQSIGAAIKAVKTKKKADFPEEMSYESNTSTIPKDQSNTPEQAAEQDYLGGEHDQSKEPDNAVTQLSSKVKGLEAVINRLNARNKMLTARLKPLEVAKLVSTLVTNGALQNNKNVIAQAINDYNELYDDNQIEFQATLRVASKMTGPRPGNSLKIKQAANELAKKEAGEADFQSMDDVEGLNYSNNDYLGLDSGEFFEDPLHN